MHEIIISKTHTHEIQTKCVHACVSERDKERERIRERGTINSFHETTEPLHLFCLENGMLLHINQILRHKGKGGFFDKFVDFTYADR